MLGGGAGAWGRGSGLTGGSGLTVSAGRGRGPLGSSSVGRGSMSSQSNVMTGRGVRGRGILRGSFVASTTEFNQPSLLKPEYMRDQEIKIIKPEYPSLLDQDTKFSSGMKTSSKFPSSFDTSMTPSMMDATPTKYAGFQSEERKYSSLMNQDLSLSFSASDTSSSRGLGSYPANNSQSSTWNATYGGARASGFAPGFESAMMSQGQTYSSGTTVSTAYSYPSGAHTQWNRRTLYREVTAPPHREHRALGHQV